MSLKFFNCGLVLILCLACGYPKQSLFSDSISEGQFRVALLGESYSVDGNASGISEVILGRLFSLIKAKDPKAIFFTGDLTLGLEKTKAVYKELNTNAFQPASEQGIYLNRWPRPGYIFNTFTFEHQLDEFSALYKKDVGNQIPFYPLIGEHEAFGAGAASIFKQHFHIQSVAPREASPLAYTVPIENALFIVFSNAYYDKKQRRTVLHEIPPALLRWLDRVLQDSASKYDFIFVIGNEPAYSTTEASGRYQGLDANPLQRDAFWELLLKYHVNAYFCSLEHLFDRTNRYGVWQVISGGAGAPFYKREFNKAFYHFLLLSVPNNKEALPVVQVIDDQGNLTDQFTLTRSRYPVFQLRISGF